MNALTAGELIAIIIVFSVYVLFRFGLILYILKKTSYSEKKDYPDRIEVLGVILDINTYKVIEYLPEEKNYVNST